MLPLMTSVLTMMMTQSTVFFLRIVEMVSRKESEKEREKVGERKERHKKEVKDKQL